MAERQLEVKGALVRHQLKQYLDRAGVEYRLLNVEPFRADFVIEASDERWVQIEAWYDALPK